MTTVKEAAGGWRGARPGLTSCRTRIVNQIPDETHMSIRRLVPLALLLAFLASTTIAQEPEGRRPGRRGRHEVSRAAKAAVGSTADDPDPDDPASDKDTEKKPEQSEDDKKPEDAVDRDEPVVTNHELEVGDETLKYTATTGMIPLENSEGKEQARIFYVAYTKDDAGPKRERPLMFCFNGGPGSASVWLHLGAIGPRIVRMPDDGEFARPPFRVVDNPENWLEFTDLVFIDPVGTGYSRADSPDLNRQYHGLRGDIESVGDFIRIYLTHNERWGSPLYLVGESYGTTRASGLSDYLVDNGIALNGVVLVSTVLNFQTLRFGQGNDLPYYLYLPSYAATAWYHKKLDDELQAKSVEEFLEEVEGWTINTYAKALERGGRMSDEERAEVVKTLARYTGLSEEYVENADLRLEIMRFTKELLRDQRRTVGRLDSRYKGIDASGIGERIEVDPSMSAIRAPYTSAFQQYIREELGFETDRPYFILGEGVGNWDYGPAGNGYADTSAALRDAFAKNPFLKVHVASGYFDLATPYFAADYTLAHMDLAPEQRANISTSRYEAGHMMYVHGPSLEKLSGAIGEFVEDSSGGEN